MGIQFIRGVGPRGEFPLMGWTLTPENECVEPQDDREDNETEPEGEWDEWLVIGYPLGHHFKRPSLYGES